jgi:hypothetical protein
MGVPYCSVLFTRFVITPGTADLPRDAWLAEPA